MRENLAAVVVGWLFVVAMLAGAGLTHWPSCADVQSLAVGRSLLLGGCLK